MKKVHVTSTIIPTNCFIINCILHSRTYRSSQKQLLPGRKHEQTKMNKNVETPLGTIPPILKNKALTSAVTNYKYRDGAPYDTY